MNCHDLKLQYQPNAVRDRYDATGQMAVLAIKRSLIPRFTQHRLRHGPFIFRLTDLHECNIAAVIDLEFACSLPISTLHPPFWLSGHKLDQLEGDKKTDFGKACNEFLGIFEQEEKQMPQNSMLSPGYRTTAMRNVLQDGMHWFWASLYEPRGMYNLFLEHIQPLFAPARSEGEPAIQFQRINRLYWVADVPGFIQRKLRDRETYLAELRSRYSCDLRA